MAVDLSDSRVSQLNQWQNEAWLDASNHWISGEVVDRKGKCATVIKKGPWTGRTCNHTAGQGTDHWGWGRCMAHGGAKKYGRAYAGALMAHKFAEELDVSPWEALLMVIRITAGRVRYCEAVLSSAVDDRELEGRASVEGEPTGVSETGDLTTGRNLSWWVDTSERERDRLARVSKAAIDAGVAQLLIEKELRNGEELAGTFVKVLSAMEAAGMEGEMLDIARTVMRKELQLALES